MTVMEAQAEHPARNDWFYGTVKTNHRRVYRQNFPEKKAGNRSQPPSPSAGRMTQEWLEEAMKIVAATPSRHTSPVQTAGTPMFAAAPQANEPSPCPALDRRDALSRSARRNRTIERVSDEILQRSSARHSRCRSDVQFAAVASQNASSPSDDSDADSSLNRRLPPKLPPQPKPRFQRKTPDVPPRRSFRTPSPSSAPPSPLGRENDLQLHQTLSPPRTSLESSIRKSFSSSPTCSVDKLSVPRFSFSGVLRSSVEVELHEDVNQINSFLIRQRAMITSVSEGEVSAKATIVLSSYIPNTSSMVAAICYAWLLENTRGIENKTTKGEIVVPVINMKRERMWEHKQAAWLFHLIGIDASALMFSDELNLEGLLMGEELSLLVVGQDILQTNGEVGSLCTILTDNYCEDAYNLLQAPNLKKLLLAGILLDTHNLSVVAKLSNNRDAEAVQLLLVGFSPNFRHLFFEQVTRHHVEYSFVEALKRNYGEPSIQRNQIPSPAPSAGRAAAQPVPALPPAPFRPTESCRQKNKFSVGKLFGFGSK